MILDATGSTQRFALKECSNISNAIATTYKGIRYILYDKEFMESIATRTNSWSKTSILAHEIGHHIYGHTLSAPPSLAASRQWELEADEYSGFVMYKLGASLKDAQIAISYYSEDGDDTYKTHPAKDKRLSAIAKGYNKAKQGANNDYSTNNSTLTAGDYFYKAYNNESDYEYQVYNYTKCLKLNSAYAEDLKPFAYYYRAMVYQDLGKDREAMIDYNIAISESINKGFYSILAYIYYRRGNLLYQKEYYKEALADMNSAIKSNPEYIDAHFMKASVYDKIGKLRDAISAYTTCIKLAEKNVSASYSSTCGSKASFYTFRGFAQVTLDNQNWGVAACNDFKKACDTQGVSSLDEKGKKLGCKLYYQHCR